MVPGNLPSQLEILSTGQNYYGTQAPSTVFVGPGLPVGTEAPVIMPNGVYFPCLVFL